MDADEYTALGGRLDMAQIDGWYGRFEDIEIDPTFLCLTDLYAAAAPLVPADWTVVDLGGYVGIQAGLFKGRYVDVDCYDLMGNDIYRPPRRYRASNATHVVSDIMAWLGANPGSRAGRCCSCPACRATSRYSTSSTGVAATGRSGIRERVRSDTASWAGVSPPPWSGTHEAFERDGR